MAVIYIKEQGAMVQKKGERIMVSKNSEILLEFPVSNIEGLALFGNVQLTAQGLQFLLQKGIDISYYSYSGQYLGQTAAESSKNIFLRFAQYGLYNDAEKRLHLAKLIVKNKVQNQLSIICNYRWESNKEWKEDVAQIEKIAGKIQDAETVNELMGIEGKCSNIYFHSFGQMFRCDFEFHGRNRRPPKDPINAIISLGYTFLTKEISSALDAESFETYLGFLHGIRYGRKSLALDVIEEFRQPVVDRMVLKLFNKQMLSKYDFDIEGEQVLLNREGFQKFCKEYERWMTEDIGNKGQTGFRSIIRRQISKLKQCFQKDEEYTPFCWEEHACM